MYYLQSLKFQLTEQCLLMQSCIIIPVYTAVHVEVQVQQVNYACMVDIDSETSLFEQHAAVVDVYLIAGHFNLKVFVNCSR